MTDTSKNRCVVLTVDLGPAVNYWTGPSWEMTSKEANQLMDHYRRKIRWRRHLTFTTFEGHMAVFPTKRVVAVAILESNGTDQT
jgi:hypothetical protein